MCKTIVWVDDDIHLLNSVKMVAEEAGYKLIVFQGFHEALEFNGNKNVRLVVLDMFMTIPCTKPNIELPAGIVLADHFSKMLPKVPIVICSAFVYQSRYMFELGKIAQITTIIDKPLHLGHLSEIFSIAL